MIERPLYIEKIMAYVDTPFVKILTGSATAAGKDADYPEDDHRAAENRKACTRELDHQLSL